MPKTEQLTIYTLHAVSVTGVPVHDCTVTLTAGTGKAYSGVTGAEGYVTISAPVGIRYARTHAEGFLDAYYDLARNGYTLPIQPESLWQGIGY